MRIVAVVGVCVLIWTLRRPEQLTKPYVWVEESFIPRTFLGFLSISPAECRRLTNAYSPGT